MSDGGGPDGGLPDAAELFLPPLDSQTDASVVFQDDFERGVLLKSDGGRWDALANEGVGGQSLVVAFDAGRAGFGMSLKDTSPSNGDFGRQLNQAVSETGTNIYVRAHAWLTSGGITGPHAIAVYSDNVPASSLAGVLIRDGFQLKCGTRSVSDQVCGKVVPWVEGSWHVIDLALEKVGNSQGVCIVRLDGVETCRMSRDWQGVNVDNIGLGATSMAQEWVGELRADNFTVTRGSPAPGRIALARPAMLPVGLCVPVRVELRDTFDGGLSPAVRTVRLGLSGAAFFASGCQGNAISSVTFDAGVSSSVIAVRAVSAGTASVSVVDLGGDLLPANASWSFTP